ncbi:MAG: choice-of-anchor tandem repeat GloVer-containing protein [Burkholderiales bacterium]
MTSPRTVFALVLAAALLAGCNGGGDGSAPPLLGASPSAGATIYAFGDAGSPTGDGAEPKGTLTAATVGGATVLFGRTAIGGSGKGCGTIFSINPDGTNYNVQYRFDGADGCDPRHDAMIVNPDDGRLYGTTQGVDQASGKTYGNWGQIFAFTPATSIPTPVPVVHVFANPSPTTAPFDGAQQHSSFSIDPVTGVLYGQTAAGGANNDGMLYAVRPDGAQFVDLHDFSKDDGRNPHGRIVLVNGVLYGIAKSDGRLAAGADAGASYGFGSVYGFPVTQPLANGPVTVLHVFAGAPDDGAYSDHGYLTPVTIGGRTILFGMTQCGGAGTKNPACKGNGDGAGVIFQVDPAAAPGTKAAFNVVYSFQANGATDGALPYGSLMYDGTYLYGTTSAGGTHGKGTVFRFLPVAMQGTATLAYLYQFGAYANDGIKPIDNVIKVGNTLYGMTVYGGAAGESPDDKSVTGSGTVFAIALPN